MTITIPFPLLPVAFLVVIFYLNITSRVVFSPLLPAIEEELGLRHGEAWSLFLLLQAGYGLGLLGSGMIASRLNHRRTIAVSTVALGVVLLVMSRSASVTGLRAGLALLGGFAGLYMPSGIATLTGEIRKEHWGKALAIHELVNDIGLERGVANAVAGLSRVPGILLIFFSGLAVSMVTIVRSFLGAGAIPPAIGYLAEVPSFSSGLILLGVVTLALLPLLRDGRSSPGMDGKVDHPNVPVR